MKNRTPYITNIQKYSIHDGKGIRTAVFFKGCPLTCAWCHNPETQSFAQELLLYPEKCSGCGSCADVCPEHAVTMEAGGRFLEEKECRKHPVTDSRLCTGCETCLDFCIQNARALSGKQYRTSDLIKELEKDRAFYEQSGGGITLSGGEVLAQDMEYVENLAKEIKKRGMQLAIDTCGAVKYERILRVLPWTDTFLYDIKLFEEEDARKWLGCEAALPLENLEKLSADLPETGTDIWIRMPVIGGVNDTEKHMERTAAFLKDKKIRYTQVNLLPYHAAGSGKYQQLGRQYKGKDFYTPSAEQMEMFAEILRRNGVSNVVIGGGKNV
ncbi:MAG: glycyl-radical enzyme activating protein [Lachnospiraceae bacterium]|nr:glycyl-radical enzyme activating protein [Lachnospiraceae bacterium]